MIDDRESELERDVLRSARRGFAPAPADEVRVLAAVKVAAFAPVSPSLGDGGAPAGHVAGGAGRWLSRLALGAAVVAGGGVGYVAGHRTGFDEGRASAVAEAPRPVQASRGVEASRDEPNERAEPREPPLAPPSTGVAPELAPIASPKSPAVVASAPNAGLDEEVRLLKRVERALRDANPRYALGLLGELERTVPGGQLVEERHAAKVMARCQLVGGSQAMIDEFATAHPGSAYATRVAETCRATEQRNPEEPDTHR